MQSSETWGDFDASIKAGTENSGAGAMEKGRRENYADRDLGGRPFQSRHSSAQVKTRNTNGRKYAIRGGCGVQLIGNLENSDPPAIFPFVHPASASDRAGHFCLVPGRNRGRLHGFQGGKG